MIEEAIKMAEKSESVSHKVGCVITDKKGNIISTGFNNETKTHPVQAEFAQRVGYPEKLYLHAEIHALVKCKDEPHTIYVARLTKGNNIGLAKPCPVCELAIKESGAKVVYYTCDEGKVDSYGVSSS